MGGFMIFIIVLVIILVLLALCVVRIVPQAYAMLLPADQLELKMSLKNDRHYD